ANLRESDQGVRALASRVRIRRCIRVSFAIRDRAATGDRPLGGILDDLDLVALDGDHATEWQTAMTWEPPLAERLVVRAAEKPARSAAAVRDVQRFAIARELDRKLGRRLACGKRGRAAILCHRGRDVGGPLEPSLDLEARDADLGELV